MEDDYCPDCGAELDGEDALYIATCGCCKFCYDDADFGGNDDELEAL